MVRRAIVVIGLLVRRDVIGINRIHVVVDVTTVVTTVVPAVVTSGVPAVVVVMVAVILRQEGGSKADKIPWVEMNSAQVRERRMQILDGFVDFVDRFLDRVWKKKNSKLLQTT